MDMRLAGAMLRRKWLYIESKMILFSLLSRTIFLHNVNINLIYFSLLYVLSHPMNIPTERVRGRKVRGREGMREKENKVQGGQRALEVL